MDIKPLFSYRAGKSFLHKMPPVLKLIFLFALTALVFFFPYYSPLYSLGFIVFARFSGFSFLQQLKDLETILPYSLLLSAVYLFSVLMKTESNAKDLTFIILQLICLVQINSLFFNTTSSMQIKESLEKFLPFKVSVLFSLFLFFIPLLFSIWAKLDYAWKARCGKNVFFKVFKLFPVFISEAFYNGQKLLYALQNRNG